MSTPRRDFDFESREPVVDLTRLVAVRFEPVATKEVVLQYGSSRRAPTISSLDATQARRRSLLGLYVDERA